jgi:hypothetical protein
VYSTSGGAGTGAVSSILLPSDAYAIPGGKKTSLRPGDVPLKGPTAAHARFLNVR